jgi:CheY-like chemotaxis protein
MAIRTVFGTRENREKKNLANKEYYKTLIESKKEATFLADIDGDLFLLNKKAQSLAGYSEEEIREYHIRDIFFTTKSFENPFDVRQFTEFSSVLYVLDVRRYLIPVMVDFREIEGQKFLGTLFPVDEKEVKPVSSESLAQPADPSPGTLLSAAPSSPGRWSVEFEHETRNLLNSMLGFSGIIAKDPAIVKDKKLLGNVEAVIRAGTRIKTLLNRVSNGGEDSYEVVRTTCLLSPLLQKAQILLDPVSGEHNIPIRIRQNDEISVFTDEALLLDLLKFLLVKAVQYTRNDNVMLDIAVSSSGDKATITIDNLGQDIPQGVINFIRRENNKDQYDLNSPALALSPELRPVLHSLNRIAGKISFTTGENMGEITTITLPLASGKDHPDDLTKLEESLRQRSLNILIVEDDKLNSAILSHFLENVSSVSTAYSGNEALNIAEFNYNKGIIFNAVVMDIGLPTPWDGILLKTEMEKRWPEYQKVPFMAQTAYTAKSLTDRITENRFSGYLLKPISRSELLRFMFQVTGKS